MSESFEPPRRSLELMNASDTALLVVDVQEKLLPVMTDPQWLVWNVRRLIEGAGVLGVPVIATEQYPQGSGPTVEELDALIEKKAPKTRFSGAECRRAFRFPERGRPPEDPRLRHRIARLRTADGPRLDGGGLASLRRGRRGQFARPVRPGDGAASDGGRRRHPLHYGDGPLRMVRNGLATGVQSDFGIGSTDGTTERRIGRSVSRAVKPTASASTSIMCFCRSPTNRRAVSTFLPAETRDC